MLGKWTKNQILPIFSLACFEAVWRTGVELAGAADLVLLPIGGLFLSKEVLNAVAIGQLLGFLLLGAATFQTLPEVFPERHLDWGNDVVFRVAIAIGVVTIASLFIGLIGRLAFFDGGSFSLVPAVITLIAVSGAAGLLTTDHRLRVVPQMYPLPTYIRYRQLPETDTLKELKFGVIVSRVLLILVFGGLALAVIAQLYPLPELFVIVVTMYEGLSGPATVRTDMAEGFLAGLRAIWTGPRGILGISYGISGLLAVVWIVTAYLTSIVNRAAVISDPVTLFFLFSTLGIGTVHAVTGLVRLVERLPAEVGNTTPLIDEKPLIPGLLIPPAALFAWFEIVRPSSDSFSYALTATVPELGVALLLAVVAVVPLLRPSLGPELPVSDYVTIALAPSLGFSIFLIAGLGLSGNIDSPLSGFYAVTLFALSPFLGLEVYRLDRYDKFGRWFEAIMLKTPVSRAGSPGERVFDLLSEICLAVIVFIIGGILALVFREVDNLFSVVISTFLWPAMASIVFRMILIPFYAPEKIID
jgi:hypothetical protein